MFPASVLFPRHPGKPDPRWKKFNWNFVDSKAGKAPYRLYFYDDEDWAARFTMPRIRRQIQDLTGVFNYSPSKMFSYLLFTSEREFRQANIFFISEGVQGITSTEEATMAIPYWGEVETFDHISKHELVHQFQVQKAADLSGQVPMARLQFVPLWFIEGMAEYYSLGGIDSESKVYLRDISLHSVPKRGYVLPGFFAEGAPGFVNTYKVGQAKIDFLEMEFGYGTAQKLFDAAARRMGIDDNARTFEGLVSNVLAKDPEYIEQRWKAYMETAYKLPAEAAEHPLYMESGWREMRDVGENLDLFDISPDGSIMAIRKVEPISGTTSIQVFDVSNPEEQVEAAHDQHPDFLSLYFLRNPTLALNDRWVGYIGETIKGPEIEVRPIEREGKKVKLGRPWRYYLHKQKILQASSIAFSSDGNNIAIVGLDARGWGNVYVIENFYDPETIRFRRLTEEHYSWRTLSWTKEGILAASDRTTDKAYRLMRLDPITGDIERLGNGIADRLSPSSAPVGRNGDWVVYQSWEDGTPQIHLMRSKPGAPEEDLVLTSVPTGAFYPKIRENSLYSLVFRGGRYRLYRIPRASWLQDVDSSRAEAVRRKPRPPEQPWVAELETFPLGSVQTYRPFITSGPRIDQLSGFLSTGTYGGVGASFSDLMRNYGVSAEFLVLGSFDRASASLFLSSQAGRSTWTAGAYRIAQERLDPIFSDGDVYTYIHKEFGVLGKIQYPLGAFSFVDAGIRVGGVRRDDFSDQALDPEWEAQNPGSEFLVAPLLRLGYDRVLYEPLVGPLKGFSALIEGDTTYYPDREAVAERVRLDLAQYWQLFGSRTVFALQGLAAAAFGDEFRNSFLVSSDDILRAYSFDDDRLFGNYVVAGKAEARFPFGSLIGFPPLRGLLGADIGSVFTRSGQIGKKVASSYTVGLTLNIIPFSLNILSSFPVRVAPGPKEDTVWHFTLRYLYL